MGILLALACTVAAADQAELVGPRIDGAVTIDGRLDEPAWDSAAQAGPLQMIGAMAEPDHRTDFAVAHDGERLLARARPSRRSRCGATMPRPSAASISSFSSTPRL